MRHHRQATIIVDFMYELYHLYDEVALTKEEGKCRSKLCDDKKKPPIHSQKLNHPEYSLLELLTVQRSLLPYSSPDWNKILADKGSAQGFKYPAERENISSKTQQQVALLAKQSKYIRRRERVKVKNNTMAVYSTQQNRHRLVLKQKSWQMLKYFSTQVINKKHSIIASSWDNYQCPREFCNAKISL
jgi:hypothetical protein